jgi:cytochrome c oxidase subunit 4
MSEAVISRRTYVTVWAALLVLLGATVGAAYINLGRLNVLAALSIASMKALIIGLYFMHLRYSPRLIWAYAGGALLWLGMMFAFSFSDYLARSLLPDPTVWLP